MNDIDNGCNDDHSGYAEDVAAADNLYKVVINLNHVAVGDNVGQRSENELRAQCRYDRRNVHIVHNETVADAAADAHQNGYQQKYRAADTSLVNDADDHAAEGHNGHLGQVESAEKHGHRYAGRYDAGCRHVDANVFDVRRRQEIRGRKGPHYRQSDYRYQYAAI